MVNFTKVLYRGNFRVIGVPVTLTIAGTTYPLPGQPDLRAIDMTRGVDLGGPVEVETTRPMASILYQDLIALGLTVEDVNDNVDDCILTMNDVERRITSAKPMPSPSGETDGQIYLFLEQT